MTTNQTLKLTQI